MGESVDTTAVLVTVSETEVPQTSSTTVIEDKESPTVVFIPPENGKLGNPLLNSSVRLLQTIDGAVISFRDVCYQVQMTVRTHGCRCRKEPKHILKNVRLVIGSASLGYEGRRVNGSEVVNRGVLCSIRQWTPLTFCSFPYNVLRLETGARN